MDRNNLVKTSMLFEWFAEKNSITFQMFWAESSLLFEYRWLKINYSLVPRDFDMGFDSPSLLPVTFLSEVKHVFCKDNIREVSGSQPKTFKSTKFLHKTFDKYRICTQIIRKVSDLRPEHLKNVEMSRFLKVGHEIALQPKLSENASSQIGSGSQKLLEIWPWFFYQLIDLVGGGGSKVLMNFLYDV